MSPSFPANNTMALLSANAIQCSKLKKGDSAFCIFSSHCDDVFFFNFDHSMSLARFFGKTLSRMKNIFAMSYPFKIFDMIVGRIKIDMVDFMRKWRRADEKSCYQSMDKNSSFRTIFVKLDSAMAVLPFGWDKIFFASYAEDIAKIGNAIKRFVARNR